MGIRILFNRYSYEYYLPEIPPAAVCGESSSPARPSSSRSTETSAVARHPDASRSVLMMSSTNQAAQKKRNL